MEAAQLKGLLLFIAQGRVYARTTQATYLFLQVNL